MRSMTGCGTGRIRKDGWEVTAEIRTVNHRFLDISLRLPRNLCLSIFYNLIKLIEALSCSI